MWKIDHGGDHVKINETCKNKSQMNRDLKYGEWYEKSHIWEIRLRKKLMLK